MKNLQVSYVYLCPECNTEDKYHFDIHPQEGETIICGSCGAILEILALHQTATRYTGPFFMEVERSGS